MRFHHFYKLSWQLKTTFGYYLLYPIQFHMFSGHHPIGMQNSLFWAPWQLHLHVPPADCSELLGRWSKQFWHIVDMIWRIVCAFLGLCRLHCCRDRDLRYRFHRKCMSGKCLQDCCLNQMDWIWEQQTCRCYMHCPSMSDNSPWTCLMMTHPRCMVLGLGKSCIHGRFGWFGPLVEANRLSFRPCSTHHHCYNQLESQQLDCRSNDHHQHQWDGLESHVWQCMHNRFVDLWDGQCYSYRWD